jgi:hypothetical protein
MSARVRIPADVDRPDRIVAGLTARQLAILAATAVLLWTLHAATHQFVPLPLFAAIAAPIGAAGAVLALGQVGGQPADRLAAAALAWLRCPRRLVPAPEGIPPTPAWAGAQTGPAPVPLRLPAQGVDRYGVVDLGADGAALVCQASPLNLHLRSPGEQQALVAAFGRWLNSLAGPVQIILRAEPVDLTAAIAQLNDAAGGLPHPALEAAARAHAAFLATLAGRADVLRRQILVVLREPASPGVADVLVRRGEAAAAALAAAGITLTVLEGPDAGRTLACAANPDAAVTAASWADPAEVITTRTP